MNRLTVWPATLPFGSWPSLSAMHQPAFQHRYHWLSSRSTTKLPVSSVQELLTFWYRWYWPFSVPKTSTTDLPAQLLLAFRNRCYWPSITGTPVLPAQLLLTLQHKTTDFPAQFLLPSSTITIDLLTKWYYVFSSTGKTDLPAQVLLTFQSEVGTYYFFRSPLPLVCYLEIVFPLHAGPQLKKIW
jgi:hypothetical protein